MNCKERVIASLERREIDRVPLALACGGPNSAYEKLRLHFKAENNEELLLKMNIDIRTVSLRYVGPPLGDAGIATLFGGTEYMRCDYSRSGGIAGTYSDGLGIRPLQNCTTVKEVADYSWPKIEWYNFDEIKENCRRHREYAVVLGGWAPLLSRVFELFGIKTAFINLYRRPNLIREVIKRITDFYYDLYDTALSRAEGGVDIVGFGDDFATQHDLMVSPKMWQSFCKQPLARLFSLGKKHDTYVFFHACGAVRKIIPDLIEIGLDILFPVQPRAKDMNHAELKEEFGDCLAFWGAVDVQKTLPFGTPDDVRREVRERIKILGSEGGYILSSSHNLLKHFPLENILAMYDEAIKTKPSH